MPEYFSVEIEIYRFGAWHRVRVPVLASSVDLMALASGLDREFMATGIAINQCRDHGVSARRI